ncbi:MAG: hypothetical protein LLG04_13720 [Parachlamydia sp.]|nr:hypothetical protein [Parachlamydia sp.]
MNLEIIEFYPLQLDKEKGNVTGTLRVKLSDYGIDILGIFVSKRKDYWYFALPGRVGTHHETGEKVRYPFIVFEDRGQHSQLMEIIRKNAPLFIEKRLVDKESPIIFPVLQPKVDPQQTGAAAKDKKTNQMSAKPPVPKVWMDLQPRKALPKSKEKYG